MMVQFRTIWEAPSDACLLPQRGRLEEVAGSTRAQAPLGILGVFLAAMFVLGHFGIHVSSQFAVLVFSCIAMHFKMVASWIA